MTFSADCRASELGAPPVSPKKRLTIEARADAGDGGAVRRLEAIARLDGAIDIGYYRNGGILPAVLRRLATDA